MRVLPFNHNENNTTTEHMIPTYVDACSQILTRGAQSQSDTNTWRTVTVRHDHVAHSHSVDRTMSTRNLYVYTVNTYMFIGVVSFIVCRCCYRG